MDAHIEKALAEAFEEDFEKLVEQGFIEPVGIRPSGEALYQLTKEGLALLERCGEPDAFEGNEPRSRREFANRGYVLTAAFEQIRNVITFSLSIKSHENRHRPMYLLDLHHVKPSTLTVMPENRLIEELLGRWGELIAAGSRTPPGVMTLTEHTCTELEDDATCGGPLVVGRPHEKDILWICTKCRATGMARSWQGTIWDATTSR